MTGKRYARQARLAALAGVTACAVAACGGGGATSKSEAGATHTSSGSSGASSSALASLKATVSAAEKAPAFVAPGPAVNAKVLKGKSLIVFPVNSQIDACQTQSEDFKALGQSLGAHVTLISNGGQPSQWQSAVEDAVGAHDAAVAMLCGVIPGAIGPQLTAAKKAGVAVVDGNFNETNNYTGLGGETAVNTAQGMEDDVADAAVNLGGKPIHALVLSTNSIIQGPAARAAVTAAIQKDSPGGSVESTVIVPIQNWATSIESDMSSALVAHPNVNAVFINFDGMTQFALPSVTNSHISGLKIYTWGGSRSVEKLMESSGSVVAADPGPDEQWDAYEAMDQVIRLVSHKPAASVNKEVDPNVFFVPANVKSFFGPGGTYGNAGFGGSAFITGFDKLWGVS